MSSIGSPSSGHGNWYLPSWLQWLPEVAPEPATHHPELYPSRLSVDVARQDARVSLALHDSCGIGELVGAHQRTHRDGRRLVVVKGQDTPIDQILHMAKPAARRASERRRAPCGGPDRVRC
jgi:hypothetical protein